MAGRRNPYGTPDHHTRRARAQGYPARSVFKLQEIDRRFALFRAGQRVLELGAAPGSWSLYAAERVGPRGQLLAVDLAEIRQALPEWVTVVRGDARRLDPTLLAGGFDLVLSDMAPSTSGHRALDQARSFELFEGAAALAFTHGRLGSSFVGKLFMSADFEIARTLLRARYEAVRTVRAAATRAQSTEVFLVAQGLTVAEPRDGPARAP